MEAIKKNKKKDRSFGLTFGFLLLGYSAFSFLYLNTFITWIISLGTLIMLVAILSPRGIHPFRVGMETIGHWMGIFNTYILLTLIYFFLFTPLNLIFRITGKDTLKLKWNKRVESYWTEMTPQNESSMKNQFWHYMETLKELLAFLKQRKKYWLWPLFIILILLGTLVVLVEGSALAPFIYSFF